MARRRSTRPLVERSQRSSFLEEFRRIDGYGNNLANPEWGMAHSYYLRLVVSDYADGVSQPVRREPPERAG